MEDFLIFCTACEQRFIDTPKVLPCGETICLACITNSTENAQLKCPLCKKYHLIPTEGFPGNKFAEKIIEILDTKLENNSIYKQVTELMKNIDRTLETIKFDQESGKQEIYEYCDVLKNKIDLCVEQQIKSLNESREFVFMEIENFQKECLKHLITKEQSIDNFKMEVEESKNLIKEEKNQLIKSKFDDKLLKDQIYRLKSLYLKVNAQKRRHKNDRLNNSNMIISLKNGSFQVTKQNTSVIDMKKYSKIHLKNLIDYSSIHDVYLMPNNNIIISYNDETDCYIEIRDLKDTSSVIKRFIKSMPITFAYSDLFQINNKIVYCELNNDGKSLLKTFDENLNELKEKKCNQEFSMIEASDTKIMAFVYDHNSSFSKMCFFDWDLNQLMMVMVNSIIYPFTSMSQGYYSRMEFGIFEEQNELTLIREDDGKVIKKIKKRGDFVESNENCLIFFEKEKFNFYDYEENLIETIDLVDFDPDLSLLIDSDRNFLFYDVSTESIYIPNGYLSSI